jgi:hypothetical protein
VLPEEIVILRRHDIGEPHPAYDFITFVPKPAELGVVDLNDQPCCVERMVATQRIVIELVQTAREFFSYAPDTRMRRRS